MAFWRPKTSAAEPRGELLEARPIRRADATVSELSEGVARVTVPLPPRGGLFFRVPEGAAKTFELDTLGLFVWNHCDGRTSVKEIIERLAGEFKINLRAAEVSTLQFLNLLSSRGWVGRARDAGPKD